VKLKYVRHARARLRKWDGHLDPISRPLRKSDTSVVSGAWTRASLHRKDKNMTNRKIVHDIKGKMSPMNTLAELVSEGKHMSSEEMNGLIMSMAKQSTVLIPQILELLDQIENKD
jgi:hypothetical protein